MEYKGSSTLTVGVRTMPTAATPHYKGSYSSAMQVKIVPIQLLE